MTIKLSSDGFAVVDTDYQMKDAKKEAPPLKGALLCGNRNTGKTTVSTWSDSFGFTHWAPMPVFPKDRADTPAVKP